MKSGRNDKRDCNGDNCRQQERKVIAACKLKHHNGGGNRRLYDSREERRDSIRNLRSNSLLHHLDLITQDAPIVHQFGPDKRRNLLRLGFKANEPVKGVQILPEFFEIRFNGGKAGVTTNQIKYMISAYFKKRNKKG